VFVTAKEGKRFNTSASVFKGPQSGNNSHSGR
jgi:hypothetical protein